MNDMNYWKLFGSTAILMTILCVGIYFYAKWDVQRFAESLGEPYTPVPQTIAPTVKITKQALRETPTIPETETGSDLERQQKVEPERTAREAASLDEFSEFLDGLGDEELTALLKNPNIMDTETEAFEDFLQAQFANSSEKDSSFIAIDELDTTQISDWIEIEGQATKTIEIEGYTINLEDLGDNVIIIDGF